MEEQLIIKYKNCCEIESEQCNIHDSNLIEKDYDLFGQSLLLKLQVFDDSLNKNCLIQVMIKNVQYFKIDNQEMFPANDYSWLYSWEIYSLDKLVDYKNENEKAFGILITFCNLAKWYIVTTEVEWNKTVLDI